MDPCDKVQTDSVDWLRGGAEPWQVKGWFFPLLLLLCVLGQESLHGNPGDPEPEGSHVLGTSGATDLAPHMEGHSLKSAEEK